MTLTMPDRPPNRSFRSPTFVLGALLGIHLAVAMMIGGALLLAREAAADSGPVCFFRSECLKRETPKNASCDGNCDTPGVSCHCFEPQPSRCGNGGGGCYVKWPAIKLSVPIGGSAVVLNLADYIGKTYNYAVGFAVLIAGVMVVVGGLQYATAGGDSSRAGAAKQRITSALIGLLLVLGAYTILNTINPDIVALRLPKVAVVKKAVSTDCHSTERCVSCGKTYAVKRPLDAGQDWKPKGCGDVVFRQEDGEPPKSCKDCQKWSDELAATNELSADCIGRGCGDNGCKADAFRCRLLKAGEPKKNDCGPGAGAEVNNEDQAKTNSMFCKTCKQNGSTCDGAGPNDNCCSGICSNGKCTTGELGTTCSVDKECTTGLNCVLTTGLHICLPAKLWGFCSSDQQCPGGSKCYKTIRGAAPQEVVKAIGGPLANVIAFVVGEPLTEAYCLPPGGPSSCISDEPRYLIPDISKACNAERELANKAVKLACFIGNDKACNAARELANKAVDSACTPGPKVQIPETGCPTKVCLGWKAPAPQICIDRESGSPCVSGGDCKSGKCADSAAQILTPSAPSGVCVDGLEGQACDDSNQCWPQFKCVDHYCR